MNKPKSNLFLALEDDSLNLMDRIFLENLKERKIIFNDVVDSRVVEMVIAHIQKFNREDEGIPIEQRKKIEIYLNSEGGCCYNGFGLINAMISSKTPVMTVCIGYAMSMALAIFIAGSERKCYKYSTFMYHEVNSHASGRNEEIVRQATENKRLQKMYDDFITSRTKLPQKKLDSIKKNMKDWFFSADEALEYEVVHEIIE